MTFTWSVSHVFLANPGSQTNLDADAVSLALSARDNDHDTLSFSATGLPAGLSINSSTGVIVGTVAATADTSSPYSVTVMASDGVNTSSQSFTWNINPRVAATNPGAQANAAGDAVSVQVQASNAANATLTYSASNLPTGLTINTSTGMISGTIAVGADSSSPYTATVTAADATASASQTFTWTVAHLRLTNPGSQNSADGATVSLPISAHDADGDALSFSAAGLPSGLAINATTGTISGTFGATAHTASPYTITVAAADASHSVSQTFTWSVGHVTLANPGNQTTQEGTSVFLHLAASDVDGDTLSYSVGALPAGLSLNSSTGVISGVLSAGDADNSPYTVTVAATDGTDASSQTFTWTVTPVITLTNPADQSGVEGTGVSLQLQATDALGATLTYSANNLPAGLSLSTSGLVSAIVSAGASGSSPYAVTVTASDGTYSESQNFTWTVTHGTNHAPVLTNPGNQSSDDGDFVALQLSATDADGDPLSYSASNLPAGLGLDPSSGLISGDVGGLGPGGSTYAVTVTASDGNGGTASQTFTWVVNDPAPRVQVQAFPATEGVDTGLLTVATFTDANPNWGAPAPATSDADTESPTFTATISWGDGTTSHGTITGGPGSFTVTGDHTYAEAGTETVTVAVTDPIGAVATAAGTVTVADAGLTLKAGEDLGALHGQSASLVLATVTDANPSSPAGDFTVSITWGDGTAAAGGSVSRMANGDFAVSGSHAYAADGTYTVSLTVKDADGVSATATSTATVGDYYAGASLNLTVASFQDGNALATPADYTATVTWGDGASSTGTVSGTGGHYTVSASHGYPIDGSYAVGVTVQDDGGSTVGTTGLTLVVVRPPLSGAGADVWATMTGVVSNAEVASFSEADAADPAAEFSATIDWGDGTGASGATVSGSGGHFDVFASHTYATAGLYPLRVVVSQAWGLMQPGLALAAMAIVPAAPNDPIPTVEDFNFIIPAGKDDLRISKSDGLTQGATNLTAGHQFIVTQQGQYGKAEVKSDGSFTYTKNDPNNWPGGDSFAYVARNGPGEPNSNTGYVAIGQPQAGGYTTFFAGNVQNPTPLPASQGGLLLEGGGEDLKSAWSWFAQRANGGNVVILRTDESGGYSPWALYALGLMGAARPNSVRTVVLHNAREADAQQVLQWVKNAQAVFLTGGNQKKLIDVLQPGGKSTQLLNLLNQLATGQVGPHAVAMGGTSAGLSILGDVVYSNMAARQAYTGDALADPYDAARIALVRPLLTIPLLKEVITDSHFIPPNMHDSKGRMGRLVAFMARMMKSWPAAQRSNYPEYLGGATALGLGVAERTAVLVNADGTANVVGDSSQSFAYFLTAISVFTPPDQVAPGKKLVYGDGQVRFIEVDRLGPGGKVTFKPDKWANFVKQMEWGVWADGPPQLKTNVRDGVYGPGV